jgi:hypothetical protein
LEAYVEATERWAAAAPADAAQARIRSLRERLQQADARLAAAAEAQEAAASSKINKRKLDDEFITLPFTVWRTADVRVSARCTRSPREPLTTTLCAGPVAEAQEAVGRHGTERQRGARQGPAAGPRQGAARLLHPRRNHQPVLPSPGGHGACAGLHSATQERR